MENNETEADRTRTRDKSVYGPGPWQHEPDRVEFEAHGFPCLIARGPVGVLCGYVAIPPGHPWHGKHYFDVPADVHGGLTYSKSCAGEICHVPKPGEPDDVWWLGFDCGHSMDYVPAIKALQVARYGRLLTLLTEGDAEQVVYRTVEYVRAVCAGLAEQAKTAAS